LAVESRLIFNLIPVITISLFYLEEVEYKLRILLSACSSAIDPIIALCRWESLTNVPNHKLRRTKVKEVNGRRRLEESSQLCSERKDRSEIAVEQCVSFGFK